MSRCSRASPLAPYRLIGLARFEAVASETLIYGFLSGVFAVAAPGILWYKANLMTYNLSVNAMVYLAPVVSLGWLLAFSLIGDVSLTWLFWGIRGDSGG